MLVRRLPDTSLVLPLPVLASLRPAQLITWRAEAAARAVGFLDPDTT